MKKLILITAALAGFVLGGTIYAVVKHERASRPFVDRIVGHLTRELALTDAQQTQVKAILEAERPKLAPLMAEVGQNRRQLHESTASGKFDEAQVRSIAAKQAQALTELIVEKERVKARIYNDVLTADQRTKADQLRERIESHFRERFRDQTEATIPVVP